MTKKFVICLFIVSFLGISFVFPKDKISEDSTSVNYSYTDWKEFYTDLFNASEKDLYKYAFLRNIVNDYENTNILQISKKNTWTLVSHKEMQGRDMIQSFYVVSPNGHKTVLVLANNDIESYKYAVANKISYSEMVVFSATSSSVSSKTEQKKIANKRKYKK